MPNQKKISILANIQEKITSAKCVVLANYQGLKVSQIQDLKKNIKSAEGEFTVVKNTLLNLALKNLGFDLPKDVQFKEPTAMLLSFKDEVSPLKKLAEFAKTLSLPTIKFGFLDKNYLSKAEVEKLSQIPPREILYAKLVSSANSPVYGFVYVLKGNLQKLVTVLNNYQKTKIA